MRILTFMSGGINTPAFSKGSSRTVTAFAVLAGMWINSVHASLQSPKGSEVFAPQPIIVLPPSKTVTIGWSYPAHLETPDLVFKVYCTTNLAQPPTEWALMTNVPGNFRSVIVSADKSQEFFLMTASNYLGESGYATRD